MHGFSKWVLSVCFTPPGLLILAALDSSVFFAAPFALDAVVIILVAQHRDRFWLYPLLATIGSLIGAGATYWMGLKIGEAGLERHISRGRLERALARGRNASGVALAMLAIVPPPFPFTPFILAAGALELNAWRFLLTLAGVKLLRFSIAAALALRYGRHVVRWLDSDVVTTIAAIVVLALMAGAAYSATRLLTRRAPREAG